MSLARLILLLVLLSGCEQLYSKDTLIIAGSELCGARWQVLDVLLRVRKETLIEDSRVKLGQVWLELTSSEVKRTVSVLISWPEGFSCVVASGGHVIRKTKSVRELQ